MARSLGMRILVLLIGLVGAAGVLMGAALYVQFSGRLSGEVEQLLTRQLGIVVQTAAARLDGARVREVYGSHRYDDAAYRSQQAALRGVQREFQLETDLYTLHREGERTRFGITCKEEPLLGEAYPLSPAMRRAFETGEVTSSGVYRDKSGWWISAYGPVRDASGTVVALVEADHALDPYVEETRRRVVRGAAVALAGAWVLTGLLGWALVRRTLRPLAELRQGARELVQGLPGDAPASPASGDEIAEVSDALGRLGAALRKEHQRVEELKIERPAG